MNTLQRLRQQFWFIPAVMCLAVAVLAEALVALDESLGDVTVPDWLDAALYRVGESGSRDILGAIASSSLAVAGTTFSITMAVLALTSSTYGPRLVRNFMADRGNQAVLGVFVATFLYSLLVLRSVRAVGDPGDPDAEVFVPHLAVNAAVVLAVVNVAVLIYFIHHISDSIQISTIARRVRVDLHATVERLYPEHLGHDARSVDRDVRLPDRLEEDGAEVAAGRGGYVTYVREDALMRAASSHDVLLALQVQPGRYVLEDTVVALVHPPEHMDDDLAEEVRSAVVVSDERSPHQDVEFGAQQLTELAVRALSPGTNDPYTAINALDDLSSGLALLAGRRTPSAGRFDDEGVLRVHAPRVDAVVLASGVLDNLRWYASASPAVMDAALTLVRRVGRHTEDRALRARLLTQVGLLTEAFERAGHQAHDVETYRARAAEVTGDLTRT
ncbi:DUF2254 domain-containing protein [Georgenia wangjunii]|uniref:DUF2254 domain-containing protein n=1 Tax=Georgenia wangjunii TaxID=3117730 RepID=UPI002F26DAB2